MGLPPPQQKKEASLGFPFGNKIEAENLWIKNLQDEPQIFIDTLRMDSWEFLDDELGQPNIWGFCLFPYKTDRTKKKTTTVKDEHQDIYKHVSNETSSLAKP